ASWSCGSPQRPALPSPRPVPCAGLSIAAEHCAGNPRARPALSGNSTANDGLAPATARAGNRARSYAISIACWYILALGAGRKVLRSFSTVWGVPHERTRRVQSDFLVHEKVRTDRNQVRAGPFDRLDLHETRRRALLQCAATQRAESA